MVIVGQCAVERIKGVYLLLSYYFNCTNPITKPTSMKPQSCTNPKFKWLVADESGPTGNGLEDAGVVLVAGAAVKLHIGVVGAVGRRFA